MSAAAVTCAHRDTTGVIARRGAIEHLLAANVDDVGPTARVCVRQASVGLTASSARSVYSGRRVSCFAMTRPPVAGTGHATARESASA